MSQWVTASFRANVNHHFRAMRGHAAMTECGARIDRFTLRADPELSECRLCAEHVYARDNGKACAHCHKVPRRAA
jgi:hypothetical protein